MKICNLRVKKYNNTVYFAFQTDKDEKDCQNFVDQGYDGETRILSSVHESVM